MPKYNKMNDKFILDACCGPRQMWTNKKHPQAIYIDIREEKKGLNPYRKNEHITPDIVMDFRDMEFEDETFKLVVFDPPHLLGTGNPSESKMMLRRKYGILDKLNWRGDLKQGFDECWRVLEEYGVLIFKWAESNIKWKEILKVIGRKPLFRNILREGTYWACFMKLPEKYILQETLE